jgi:hypothetical protein
MMAQNADPGIGRTSAEFGSREWAERVRLDMQAVVSSIETKPEGLQFYADLVRGKQAFLLMNKPNGTFFKTFEEFCEHRSPWGLGRPWSELELYVLAACKGNKAKAAGLTTSAAAAPTLSDAGKKGGETAGRGRPKASDSDNGPNVTVGNHDDQRSHSRPIRGTSAPYLAARIARDAPIVHEAMKAGEFKSVRAAAIAAGVIKAPDPVKVAARALEKTKAMVRSLTRAEQSELYAWLGKVVVAAGLDRPLRGGVHEPKAGEEVE